MITFFTLIQMANASSVYPELDSRTECQMKLKKLFLKLKQHVQKQLKVRIGTLINKKNIDENEFYLQITIFEKEMMVNITTEPNLA